MKSWHVLSCKRYENGCRNVPGSDTNLRVISFYGEQPWMGVPSHSSPFSKWSIMIIVVSETQLLSFMDSSSCSFKWNWFQWKLSIYPTKMSIEYSYMNDAIMLTFVLPLLL